jgi:hypothetical protein
VLNSSYELRLFQLLPVLHQLDKDKAEELLRDNAEAKAKLANYPQGMQSLRTKGDIFSFGITDSDAPQAAEVAARDEGLAQLNQRMIHISEESGKDPAQAMADALGLPINLDSRSPRAQMLAQIAERSVRTNPLVAKSALNELIKIQDEVPLDAIANLTNVPKIYLDLGDTDGAEKALKSSLKAAEKVYGHDTDAEDPNKAFKGTWPSADMWRKCVQVAAKISPAISEEIIGNIPDPDIAAAEKVAFASSLLGETSEESILVGDCRKTHSGFYTSASN